MKKRLVLFMMVLCGVVSAHAQLKMTKTATISFHSHTILENIDAENNQAMGVIDAGKKSMAFSCLMKQFIFPRKLMQQHFNENYVESDKFPKATFSGSFAENVDFTTNGNYAVTVSGRISLHGVTREIHVPATLIVKDGKLIGTATFKLKPSDFDISVPFIVRDKIEKENTVKVYAEWNLN